MTANEIAIALIAGLCGIVLLGAVVLGWALAVTAKDTIEVPDGNEEYLG